MLLCLTPPFVINKKTKIKEKMDKTLKFLISDAIKIYNQNVKHQIVIMYQRQNRRSIKISSSFQRSQHWLHHASLPF